MTYTLDHIARIVGSGSPADARGIENILLDSRKVYSPANSLFFALKGSRRDGHHFIPELYKKGVRSFVVQEPQEQATYPLAQFIRVNDTLQALQALVIFHRQQFDIPVIGITGSNGKTIVKEWLYQLLHKDFAIARSPKSYNSQIGVPLSVWQLNEQHTLGIFEAGISRPGEMEKLEPMIRPSIAVLTNIGDAHDEGFNSKEEKLAEKMRLSSHATLLIGREQDISGMPVPEQQIILTWGKSARNALQIKQIIKEQFQSSITICTGAAEKTFAISFTDDASIENAITCYLVLMQLEYAHEEIARRMLQLQPVNMRLELKKGINQCTVINDSYSADLGSLSIALDFLDQQSHESRKTVILSDLLQSGVKEEALYIQILDSLRKHRVGRLIGIGEQITRALHAVPAASHEGLTIELFPSTDAFLRHFLSSQFKEETILVKGARVFGFEQIVQQLELKVHQTVLEINLNAIVHNANVYKNALNPSTRIMAMVKAFAYGSGGAEIAGVLQYHQVDYLGVAYADEGVELRRTGVDLPIMVLNPEETAFESIVENNLEPDIYSPAMLQTFMSFLEQEGLQGYPVHIEIETGMNRLGFAMNEVEALAAQLKTSTLVKVKSVFTHLAASEEAAEDEYTRNQYQRFIKATEQLQGALPYPFLRHISNTAAIFRFPDFQLDMVRLGIGLYGIDSAIEHQNLLHPAASLKSTIAQLKKLKKGESVSYNRKGIVSRDAVIATVRIGYADGYSRRLGYGIGHMIVKGQLAPVIGTVCMDMTMIDVTDIPGVEEGDEVIIFGDQLPVQQLAKWAGTIPYEIMTGISQRVKRVYFEE